MWCGIVAGPGPEVTKLAEDVFELELDRTGIVHSIDDLGAAILGTTSAVLSGKNLVSFIPPGHHEFFYEGWARVVEGKRSVLFCTCEHSAGHFVPLELRFVGHVEDGDGVFFALRCIDRSFSSEAHSELEAIRESYLLLAETTTDAIV